MLSVLQNEEETSTGGGDYSASVEDILNHQTTTATQHRVSGSIPLHAADDSPPPHYSAESPTGAVIETPSPPNTHTAAAVTNHHSAPTHTNNHGE